MIVGKTFNYIHVMKTGGSWMQRALEQFPKEVLRKKTHQPFSALTKEELERPTFATVRNPWDWYVSMYHFMHVPKMQRIPEQRELYAQSFADVIRSTSPHKYELTKHIAEMTKRDDGREREIYWRKYEDGLPALLEEMLYAGPKPRALSQLERRQIRGVGRVNWSTHRHYREYYTPELREIVATRDREIIARYGYEF